MSPFLYKFAHKNKTLADGRIEKDTGACQV